MHTNSQLTVAIHILTVLAYANGERMTSEYISCSVTTNPVVIRRLLGDLRRAGLVSSQPGIGGGWQLTRQPETITLNEIYQAMKDGPLFPMHHQKPNPQCDIGRTIQQALAGVFDDAEEALEKQFAQITVADVLARVKAAACPGNS